MSYNPYAATMSQNEYDFLAHWTRWGQEQIAMTSLIRRILIDASLIVGMFIAMSALPVGLVLFLISQSH